METLVKTDDRRRAAYNIVLANIPPNFINFHNWLLMKIFLTFGFGARGGTSQVPLRYASVKNNNY